MGNQKADKKTEEKNKIYQKRVFVYRQKEALLEELNTI